MMNIPTYVTLLGKSWKQVFSPQRSNSRESGTRELNTKSIRQNQEVKEELNLTAPVLDLAEVIP